LRSNERRMQSKRANPAGRGRGAYAMGLPQAWPGIM